MAAPAVGAEAVREALPAIAGSWRMIELDLVADGCAIPCTDCMAREGTRDLQASARQTADADPMSNRSVGNRPPFASCGSRQTRRFTLAWPAKPVHMFASLMGMEFPDNRARLMTPTGALCAGRSFFWSCRP